MQAHFSLPTEYIALMPVKMKDIASELGVSLVTVSKALRNHPDISKKTRERVEAKAKELNYRPNLTARSLVTGRSSLIGFIVPDLIHPFFAEIAKALSHKLREHGYFLVISSSEEDSLLENDEMNHMLAHRLDAIIVASCAPNAEALSVVQGGDTPLILVDRSFQGFNSHFVGADDYTSGKLATEHLLATGCTRIAHIRGPENSTGKRRLKAFRDTMAKNGRPLSPEYIIEARSVDVGWHHPWQSGVEDSQPASVPAGWHFLLQRSNCNGSDSRSLPTRVKGARRSRGNRLREPALGRYVACAAVKH